MRKNKVSPQVTEVYVKALAFYLYPNHADNIGFNKSYIITGLCNAFSHILGVFNNWQDTINYFSQTMDLTAELSFSNIDVSVDPEILMDTPSFIDNKQWNELSERITREPIPIKLLVNHMRQSGLLSFTEMVDIIRLYYFPIFSINQVHNKYSKLIEQTFVLILVDHIAKVPYELFYNERYE